MAVQINAGVAASPAALAVSGYALAPSVTGATVVNRQVSSPVTTPITVNDLNLTQNTSATTVSDYTNLVALALSNQFPAAWTTSNPAVATVDQTGYVTWVSNGAVTITLVTGPMVFKFNLTMTTTVVTVNVFTSWVTGSLGAHVTSQLDSLLTNVTTLNQIQIFNQIIWGDPPPANAFVRNPNCWAAGLKGMTAIAVGIWIPIFDGGFTEGITVIAPDICMTCQHAGQPNGTHVYWCDANNNLVTRDVIASAQVGATDIRINRLSSPLPNTIEVMRFLPSNLTPGNGPSYLPGYAIGLPPVFCLSQYMYALAFDFNGVNPYGLVGIAISVAPKETNRINLWNLLAAAQPPAYGAGAYTGGAGAHFITGDSGHVACLIVNGELLVHTTGWTSSGGGPAGWLNLAGINSTIAALGSASTVSVADLSAFPTY